MKLKTFLKTEGITAAAFADAIGVKKQSVYRYKSGECIPEKSVMAKIYEITGGKVTANDFYNTPTQKNCSS